MKQLKDLKEDLLNNKIQNFYVFYGEDYGLRKHYINYISKNFKHTTLIEDLDNFSLKKSNYALFATHYLFIAYNCDSVLNYSHTQIVNFIKKLQTDCFIFDFEKLSEDSILIKEFDSYVTYFPCANDNIGKEFVNSEISLITESRNNVAYNCYNNYGNILLETDKIKSYAREKNTSEENSYQILKSANQLMERQLEYNNDIIVNDILTNNYTKFGMWETLLSQYFSNEFWYNLSRTINDFLIAYFVVKYGYKRGSTIAYEQGFSWGRTKVIRELLIPFNSEQLLNLINELCEMDYLIKTGKMKGEDAFRRFVYVKI